MTGIVFPEAADATTSFAADSTTRVPNTLVDSTPSLAGLRFNNIVRYRCGPGALMLTALSGPVAAQLWGKPRTMWLALLATITLAGQRGTAKFTVTTIHSTKVLASLMNGLPSDRDLGGLPVERRELGTSFTDLLSLLNG